MKLVTFALVLVVFAGLAGALVAQDAPSAPVQVQASPSAGASASPTTSAPASPSPDGGHAPAPAGGEGHK